MKKWFILFACMMILSCRTDGMLTKRSEKTQSYLVGKIYDGDNSSCTGVKVSLYREDDENPLFSETSDVTGSVYFPPVDFGSYLVRAEKNGYLEVSLQLSLEISEQSLYLTMLNEDQLIDRAVAALENDNFSLAYRYLRDLESISENNPYGIYLQGIMAWKEGDSQEALSLLERLINSGEDDLYILKLKDLISGEQEKAE